MNKLTKSAIAGAAGIALLLGGAGSLAYWNNSATVGATTINSGTMTIAANTGTTTYYTGTTNSVSLIVPGDSVTITQPVTINATGDNLKAALSIDTSALLSASLLPWVTTTVTAYAGTTQVSGLSNLTAAVARTITSVKVVVSFPSTVGDTVAGVNHGTEGQGLALKLGDLKVLLTQI